MTKFMEVDGTVREISGETGGILLDGRDKGKKIIDATNQVEKNKGVKRAENITNVFEFKRRRVKGLMDKEGNMQEVVNEQNLIDGPKNDLKVGPVQQAHLEQ